MLSWPVPLFSCADLDLTARFWQAMGADCRSDGERLSAHWDGAVLDYLPGQRVSQPRITYGVGFVWNADLALIAHRARQMGLWTVADAVPHDGQSGFDLRLQFHLSIACLGQLRLTPSEGVGEVRLFDPDNNLVRCVAGPPQPPPEPHTDGSTCTDPPNNTDAPNHTDSATHTEPT